MLRNLIFFAFLLLTLSGCTVEAGRHDENLRAAESAMEKYRRYYAAGRFDSMYELASPELRQAVSLADFTNTAQDLSTKFGALESSRQLAYSCFPGMVNIVYEAKYVRGTLIETTRWRVIDKKAEMLFYGISTEKFDVDTSRNSTCDP
jgi:hypothetical protein